MTDSVFCGSVKKVAAEAGIAKMSASEIVAIIIGGAVIILVLRQLRRNGAVRPTLDVDPDSRSGIGGGPGWGGGEH
jgi:hypothetical protein